MKHMSAGGKHSYYVRRDGESVQEIRARRRYKRAKNRNFAQNWRMKAVILELQAEENKVALQELHEDIKNRRAREKAEKEAAQQKKRRENPVDLTGDETADVPAARTESVVKRVQVEEG